MRIIPGQSGEGNQLELEMDIQRNDELILGLNRIEGAIVAENDDVDVDRRNEGVLSSRNDDHEHNNEMDDIKGPENKSGLIEEEQEVQNLMEPKDDDKENVE